MEQTPSLEISRTAPTIECERDVCKRRLARTLTRRVKVRVGNGNGNSTMLVCPECYNYYQYKSSTVTTTSRKSLTCLFWCDTKAVII